MKKIIILSLLTIIGILFATQVKRGLLSILILVDIVRPSDQALSSMFFDEPFVSSITIPNRGNTISADLYKPKGKGKFCPLLLIHGADPFGKKNAQIVHVAKNLARIGYLVLVPDLVGVKTFHMRMTDVENILLSYEYLSGHTYAIQGGGGMMGLNFGVGPMLLAAADSRIRDKVRFLVTFNGYCDLRSVLFSAMTGAYAYKKYHGFIKLDATVPWMLAYRNLDLLPSLEDRSKFRKIIEMRNRYEIISADALAESLHSEGKALYAFLLNKDIELFKMYYEKLPQGMRECVYQLSPVRVLKYINAYCIVIHAMDDGLIPYTESIRFADGVGNLGRVHLALLPQFMQWESAEPSGFDWMKRYILGGWRLFYAIYDMIEKRQ